MKIIIRVLLFTFLASTFCSCDNELDIIDEYKDIPVVYGLLNRNDSSHYVRIEKGFLGEGNAFVFAQSPDSIYYDTSIVSIFVYEKRPNLIADTLIGKPTYGIIKDEGLFTDENHVIYQLNRFTRNPDGSMNLIPEFILKDDAVYTIEIKNKLTGKSTKGSTKLVNQFYQQTLFPSTKVNLASEFPYNVRISTGVNGKVYGLIMRFKYKEVNLSTGFITSKFIDYYLPNQNSRTINGSEEMIFLLYGDQILDYVSKRILPNTNVSRPVGYVTADYIFTVGSEDLYNYIEINSPSNTINYIPDYSNLDNGKGIFSSRLVQTVKDLKFNTATQDSISLGRFTGPLFN